MEASFEKTLETCRNQETALSSRLAGTHVSPAGLTDLLESIQSACKTALLANLEAATSKEVEDRLWAAHQKIHNHYRAAISKDGGKKIVEQRKLLVHYVKFLKNSQSFYRGYIWALCSVHGGIPELEKCAQAVRPHDTHPRPQISCRIDQMLVLRSCHRSLIQLGDLSRYRETSNVDRAQKWGPAIGYYELAESILPASGIPDNQLAILQITRGNHFKAIYHLYRSLCANEPHPQAEVNLRRAFKQIKGSWDNGDILGPDSAVSSVGASKMLLVWYLRLLEVSYHGRDQVGYHELEGEVDGRLKNDLEAGKMDLTLRRIVLINVSAIFQSSQTIQSVDFHQRTSALGSYHSFVVVMLRLFTTLLSIVEDRVRFTGEDSVSSSASDHENAPIKPALESLNDILPSLRQCSLWLNIYATKIPLMIEKEVETAAMTLWNAYARCMSVLAAKFPPDYLQDITIDHILPEDKQILGFKPLQCESNSWVLYPTGMQRPRSYDVSSLENGDVVVENLGRIKDMLAIALGLTQNSNAPLHLDQSAGRFYTDFDLEQRASVTGAQDIGKAKTTPASTFVRDPESHLLQASSQTIVIETTGSIETMVDDLVKPLADLDVACSLDSLPEHDEPSTPPSAIPLGQQRASLLAFPPGTSKQPFDVGHNQSYTRQYPADLLPVSTTSTQPPAQAASLALLKASLDSEHEQATAYSRRSLPPTDVVQGHLTVSPRQQPAISIRTSPLAPPGLSRHSRGDSSESTSSKRNIPTDVSFPLHTPTSAVRNSSIWSTGLSGSAWQGSSSATPLPAHDQASPQHHLGNGTFGTIWGTPDSLYPSSNNALATPAAPGSSLPFGPGQSVWNSVSASSPATRSSNPPTPWNTVDSPLRRDGSPHQLGGMYPSRADPMRREWSPPK